MDRMTDVSELLYSRSPKVGRVKFVAIDGHGGSGKSSLAELLSRKLQAEVIRTDDFASWDNPLDWWPSFIQRVFQPIAAGARTLSYPRSSWWDNHHPEAAIDQPVTKVMIIEGLSALRKEFRDYLSLGIFVDTPEAVCLERVMKRDAESGKTKGHLKQLWQKWLESENAYLERDQPQAYADIIIDGTKPFEEQII